MGRRLVLTLLAILCLAAPAAAGDIHGKKAKVDAELADTQAKLAAARSRETRLNAQIAKVSALIDAVEGRVRDVSAQLAVLERDLALHQTRLHKLTALFNVETRRVMFLRRQYDAALTRLNRRVVAIYESDDPSALDVVLSSKSFTDVIQQLDYLAQIGNQDKAIARSVADAQRQGAGCAKAHRGRAAPGGRRAAAGRSSNVRDQGGEGAAARRAAESLRRPRRQPGGARRRPERRAAVHRRGERARRVERRDRGPDQGR